ETDDAPACIRADSSENKGTEISGALCFFRKRSLYRRKYYYRISTGIIFFGDGLFRRIWEGASLTSKNASRIWQKKACDFCETIKKQGQFP
ncbi:MAG: hypothetical protein Q4C06_06415, partial [Bacillota bacterium]|nr:hypothetical protein [Bacillota bacterium]